MKEAFTIAKNRVITMQYALSNADGVIIRQAGDTPVTGRLHDPGYARSNTRTFCMPAAARVHRARNGGGI